MEYPQLIKVRKMLSLFDTKQKEAFKAGLSSVNLQVQRGGRGLDSALDIKAPTPLVSVVDEIPELRSAGEAVAIFDRLYREDYIAVDFGRKGPSQFISMPAFLGLTIKGLQEIGEWPDPDEKFALALEQMRESVADNPEIPAEQKRDLLDTATKLSTLARNVGGIGRAFFDGFSGLN